MDWDKEFIFLDKVREINEKCYQTWYDFFVVHYLGCIVILLSRNLVFTLVKKIIVIVIYNWIIRTYTVGHTDSGLWRHMIYGKVKWNIQKVGFANKVHCRMH